MIGFSDTNPTKLTTWENIKNEFITEFQLLRDNNEIVVEIYTTIQRKNETVCVYAKKLKELVNKMEGKLADGLKKRWFIEGLRPELKRKMKIVLPSSYTEAYNRAMDLESEQKTKKTKRKAAHPTQMNHLLKKITVVTKKIVRRSKLSRRI